MLSCHSNSTIKLQMLKENYLLKATRDNLINYFFYFIIFAFEGKRGSFT